MRGMSGAGAPPPQPGIRCEKQTLAACCGGARDFRWIARGKRLLQLPIQLFIEFPLFALLSCLGFLCHDRYLPVCWSCSTAAADWPEYVRPRWTSPPQETTRPLRNCFSREVAPARPRRRNGENVHFEGTQGFFRHAAN